jgi:hypothetical protein
MGYILCKKKKIAIERRKKNPEQNNVLYCETVEELFAVMTSEEKEKVCRLISDEYKHAFYDKLADGMYDSVAKEIVSYMNSHKKLKTVYCFQQGYDELEDYIEKDGNCRLSIEGDFKPVEYEQIGDFLKENSEKGEIRYNSYFMRNIFMPDSIINEIKDNVTVEADVVLNEYLKYAKTHKEFILKIDEDFVKFFITTDYYKDNAKRAITRKNVENILSGKVTKFVKKDFFDLYLRGCELLGIEAQNIEYADGYNEYFADMIFKAYKSLNIPKALEKKQKSFTPVKQGNISKKILSLENSANSVIKDKIPCANRLLNKQLVALKSCYESIIKYQHYCADRHIEIKELDADSVLKAMAIREAVRYEISEIAINLSDILSSKSCVNDMYEHGLDFVLTYTYINEETKKDIKKLIPDSPEKEYPLARQMDRHFIIHYGPTNSGKTYQAIEELKKAKSGIYLGPLRLLALEVQDNLNESGVPCSLLTGEEEDIIENAEHMSSTVEKLDTTKYYDVCVIDECQMISDKERGFAWTKAILGVQAETIYLCMGPEALNITKSLIELCGDTYEVVEHERRSALEVSNPIKLTKKFIKKGDAYIVFSKKKVLAVAAELINKGIKTSMIYGNLPYSVRKKQVSRFLNGETDVIVSTNAIGMGINLPVRRIIFLEDRKFNGECVDYLTITDIKQIAGRAGRNKETGYVTSTFMDNSFISDKLYEDTPEVKQAYLGFSDEIISIDAPLPDILKVWRTIDTPKSFRRMNIDRYIVLDESVYVNVPKHDKLKMISIAFDDRNQYLLDLWRSYCFNYERREEIEKPKLVGAELSDYENYYQALELYYSFARNFNYDIDLEWLNKEKGIISEKINEILVSSVTNFQKKCEICGKKMRWDSPYSTCRECYENRFIYGYNWY